MPVDKYEWMEQKWGFQRAPIPADGIRRPTDPFSRDAVTREVDQFERKFILGGIKGGLTYGYLWSLPNERFPTESTGTGYGKTSLLLNTESRINLDFGTAIAGSLGLRSPPKICAAYSCLNNEDTRGLFALLFAAVERWSSSAQCPGPNGLSVMGAARQMIVDRLGCDEDDQRAIESEVNKVRRALPGAATLPPLREEVIEAFCAEDEDGLLESLADVTPTGRSRNGLSFFESAAACLFAAGVEHIFFFLDQLEYMVTNRSVTKVKKSQEIARFRTVFTQNVALVNRCHVIFTLHHRASQDLSTYWDQNRLPPFDPRSPGNQNAVVVLEGLESPAKIKDLVLPYFDSVRPPMHSTRGAMIPLSDEILTPLWQESTARPGIILRRIATAIDLAAEANQDVIDMGIMSRVLGIRLEEPDAPAAAWNDDDASSLIG
jgi:hypothetical protein